jgi:hypothetical protein
LLGAAAIERSIDALVLFPLEQEWPVIDVRLQFR